VIEYHNPYSCNSCSEENEVCVIASDDVGILHEGETKCKKCEFKDYWAYGFFASSAEIISKCKTYSLPQEGR